jgi:hypothetical protein
MNHHHVTPEEPTYQRRTGSALRYRPGFAAGALLAFLAALLFWLGDPTWAAPPPSELQQTVPLPTPSPTSASVPTATPTPDADDDEDDEDDQDEEETDDAGGQSDPQEEEDFAVEFDEPTPTPTPGGPSTTTTEAGAEADAETGTAAESAPALPEAQYTGTVNVLVLNVRTGPGDDFPVVGTVFQDEEVGLLGRDAANSWWLICCPFGREAPGWVGAEFIDPEFAPDDALELLPEVELDGADAAADQPRAMPGDSELELAMHQDPPFTWQGQRFEIVYILRNTSDVKAAEVELRNDFPAELEYIEVAADDAAEITTQPSGADSVLAVTWPTLAAGEEAVVRVALRVTTNLPAGTVLENLAVVNATNADGMTAGLTISMPPAAPPDFQ